MGSIACKCPNTGEIVWLRRDHQNPFWGNIHALGTVPVKAVTVYGNYPISETRCSEHYVVPLFEVPPVLPALKITHYSLDHPVGERRCDALVETGYVSKEYLKSLSKYGSFLNAWCNEIYSRFFHDLVLVKDLEYMRLCFETSNQSILGLHQIVSPQRFRLSELRGLKDRNVIIELRAFESLLVCLLSTRWQNTAPWKTRLGEAILLGCCGTMGEDNFVKMYRKACEAVLTREDLAKIENAINCWVHEDSSPFPPLPPFIADAIRNCRGTSESYATSFVRHAQSS